MNKENMVQSAIIAALEVHCDRNWAHTDIFAPYPNQQGADLVQYCADVIAKISRSRILVIEVKELDLKTKSKGAKLPAYDAYQHWIDWHFEDLDVPINYAYAAVENLCYFESYRTRNWPDRTLLKVHLAKPSNLFATDQQFLSQEPDTSNHGNLLAWLLEQPPICSSAEVLALMLSMPFNKSINNRFLIIATDSFWGKKIEAINTEDLKNIIKNFVKIDDKKNERKKPSERPDNSSQPTQHQITKQEMRSALASIEERLSKINIEMDTMKSEIAAKNAEKKHDDEEMKKIMKKEIFEITKTKIKSRISEKNRAPLPKQK